MNETTSTQKIARKARQIYRKEMRKEAEEMGKLIGNVLKPKPRFIPWFLWLWAISFFIKVKNK